MHIVKSVHCTVYSLETYVDPAADKYLLETADKAKADAQSLEPDLENPL